MTNFYFKAVASNGQLRTGAIHAETERRVAQELRRQGLTPVYVGREPKKSLEIKLPAFTGARRKDVLFFTQELSTLLNAGVPLDRALSITSELTERASFRALVQDVLRVLKGGRTLADSLATHPEYFSDLYINMTRAGEASGSLAVVFERLSEFERTRDDLRAYILSSMAYPCLLSLVGIGSILVLMNFVVPRFASVFQESHMEIPLPTKMMLVGSNFLQSYGWMLVTALVVFVVGMYTYVRTAAGRLWWDTLRLKVPVLGDALRKMETARFARAMGTLVSNSVPLVQSIAIAGATLNNRRISGSLEGVSMGVKRGEGIAAPLKKAGQFPPLAAHLLSVGEETGHLDTMFERMADIYDADTRQSIRRFTSLFEPLVILVMGIVVGTLILSMLLAIVGMNDVAM
ncbi:MAG TPA: type II secretion system F family protein [Bryobacteraceae bacterium]|nr:type II secretion system F family protein [Bryobacteraceae bacterium]HUO32254.1 type II secretion system F family protein [Bryobacteraceae bacterium]